MDIIVLYLLAPTICSRKFDDVMWFLLLLMLLFCLLLWLPVRVEIDTALQKYRASWKGIFAVWCVPDEAGFHWFFQIFFWKTAWKTRAKTAQTTPEPVIEKRKSSKPGISFSIHKIRPLFRVFSKAIRIERLRINWDTGDFMYNAWLYPAFRRLSRGRRQLFINFFGVQELAIILQTRLGLLFWAGLRAVFILKK